MARQAIIDRSEVNSVTNSLPSAEHLYTYTINYQED